MKFGGTSVANINKIRNVASIVENEINGNKLVIVLSAMAGETNKMQQYIDEISSDSKLENDLILTSGENVTIALLSAILKKKKIRSIPLLGWQVPIITDENYQKAKILNIDKERINDFFKQHDVLIIAGFQGINSLGFVTSLGRGSDTTAVAIASAIEADRCDIYTDVDGVYNADLTLYQKQKNTKISI